MPIDILVIEDDPAIRALIAQALRDEGYRAVALAGHPAAVRQGVRTTLMQPSSRALNVS